MRLTLRLMGPPRIAGTGMARTLERGSMVIGRSAPADWILPDQEKVLSKAHCRIDADEGGFTVTDTSTNGVSVNAEVIGFGLPRLLADGDALLLGDVALAVQLEAVAAQRQPEQATPASVSALPLDPGGPFAPLAEPVRQPVQERTVSRAVLDDWWKDDAVPHLPGSPDAPPAMPEVEVPQPPQEVGTIPSMDVLGIVQTLPMLDPISLARAIDSAAVILPDGDRQRFRERLRSILHGHVNAKS